MSAAANSAVAALLQHGQDYAGQDITGWHISEKLDGCRAYWNGHTLYSKTGHTIHAPRITANLPAGMALDGELYAGPGHRELARKLVQYGHQSDQVQFVAFDAPEAHFTHNTVDWIGRLTLAARYARVVPMYGHRHSHADIAAILKEVLAHGGEGLMAWLPDVPALPGRSRRILKLKTLSLELLTQADEVAA